ncbi:MAG: hypothetical protein ACRD93_05015 [Nitrososphaeraceae archaeon]
MLLIIGAITITFTILIMSAIPIYALNDPNMDTVDDVVSFCRLFPDVDITEFVKKGNVSQIFTATTCEEYEDIKEGMEDFKGAMKDQSTLHKLENEK